MCLTKITKDYNHKPLKVKKIGYVAMDSCADINDNMFESLFGNEQYEQGVWHEAKYNIRHRICADTIDRKYMGFHVFKSIKGLRAYLKIANFTVKAVKVEIEDILKEGLIRPLWSTKKPTIFCYVALKRKIIEEVK